jgi:DNA invertase Pin-like site-specific DNA recombinase
MPKVAIYARVSTTNGDQNPETQLTVLREYCQQRGWPDPQEYVDRVSGAKESRPALNRLMEDAKRRKFDTLLIWKLDRFGRSLRHLLNSLAEFDALGISFVSYTNAIDTTTPAGKLMFSMLGAFAEFERDLIRERVKAGMARARKSGTRSGKKIGRPSSSIDIEEIRKRREAGESLRTIAKDLGVSAALLVKREKLFRNESARP